MGVMPLCEANRKRVLERSSTGPLLPPLDPARFMADAAGAAFEADEGLVAVAVAVADKAAEDAGAPCAGGASSRLELDSGVVGTWSGVPCGDVAWLLLPLLVELRLSGRCGLDELAPPPK